MSLRLAIYKHRVFTWEANPVVFLAPGTDPNKVKDCVEQGFELVQVVDLPVDHLPGMRLNELYLSSSSLHEDEETIRLMEDYPAFDDPGIRRHQMEEDREFFEPDDSPADTYFTEAPEK